MKCKAQDALIPKSWPNHNARTLQNAILHRSVEFRSTHWACLIRIIPFNGAIHASVKRIRRRVTIYTMVYHARACVYLYIFI